MTKKEIKILKSLANAKRIEILELLEAKSGLNVGDIAKEIHLSFKSVSKHLQKLAEADLIEQQRDGLYVNHLLKNATKRLLQDVAKFKS